MTEVRAFPLRFPLIVFAEKDVADAKTGLHTYEDFITVAIPGKGDCLPVFESGQAVQQFFGEQQTAVPEGVLFEQKSDLLLLLVAVEQAGIQWVAVNPADELNDIRFHRISELLNAYA